MAEASVPANLSVPASLPPPVLFLFELYGEFAVASSEPPFVLVFAHMLIDEQSSKELDIVFRCLRAAADNIDDIEKHPRLGLNPRRATGDHPFVATSG